MVRGTPATSGHATYHLAPGVARHRFLKIQPVSDGVTRALIQARRLLRGDIYGLALESTTLASIPVSEASMVVLPPRTFSKAFPKASGACHFVSRPGRK